MGSEKEISVGCLVEDNSTAASSPNPPLTLRSGLPQSRHMYSSFLPSPEAHVAGASENLFPETFSTMWPLGRRGRQRGSKRYLQPPKPPSELWCYHQSVPTSSSVLHLTSILSWHLLHGFSFSRCGLQGPPVPESPKQLGKRAVPQFSPQTC